MKQSVFTGIPEILDEKKYAHGGNLRKMAEKAGCAPEELLDFSASMNPLGPPPWLGLEVGRALSEVVHYPDPDCTDLVMAACEAYKVWPTQVLPGNGASELLHAAVALGGFRRAIIPSPTYVDYARVCSLHRLEMVQTPLKLEEGFQVDMAKLGAMLTTPSLVFLCQPNNPTGQAFDPAELREVATMFPQSRFIVDESYAEFMPGNPDRLIKDRPANVITIVSLTKFFSIPGLRLGLAFANPDLILGMKRRLPTWSVNTLAQRVGARCLRDTEYTRRTKEQTRLLRENLAAGMRRLPGIKVYPSSANFLLCKVDRLGQDALPLYDKLLKDKVAIRLCGNFEGLDNSWFRVAVRSEEDNERLLKALKRATGTGKAPLVKREQRTPALMLQGTCSNAGKSVLAAAFCRILLQDGYRVAPFKAQNMSLNSFVTDEGGEMGRAQVTQAAACRLKPDVRMNPVLLKPGSDTGSQVIVMGQPVGNMSVRQYVDYKPRAWEAVKAAYDSLANEHDIMVLEGAGSPAEVNLKQHDIVNMAMAKYADAKVILAGDIDRGGVFASLVGTMNLLTQAERDHVLGFAINRFRGDATLLDSALGFTFQNTGKPVLGVVPYIHNLGLPEEDSVSFKNGIRPGQDDKLAEDQCVDIAVIDLPRISNFNDIDPLFAEPDVRVRVVTSAHDLGRPDAVIIPGSKSTVPDMKALKGMGMAAAIRELANDGHRTRIIGICGGFQMLGQMVDDPYGLESDSIRQEGFGLLPIATELAAEKTLKRTMGVHCKSGRRVHGYEIHHGLTRALSNDLRVSIRDQADEPLGFGLPNGRVWGTYLHGLFDSDEFRRWFVNELRMDKGLDPLEHVMTTYDLEASLDHLASVVREAIDMEQVYSALGFGRCCKQVPLFYKL